MRRTSGNPDWGRALAATGLAAALWTTLCPPAASAAKSEGRTWWDHVTHLASDRMQGRPTSSKGYDPAAAYVADQFRRYGLSPAGTKGFLQPVKFVAQRVIAERSSVTLVGADGEQPLILGQDLNLTSRNPQPARAEAPLIFIGYGLHIPEAGHDDFARQDLRGKIAVMINGGPGDLPAALKSSARASQTMRALERGGAVGVITVLTPKSMDIAWERQAFLATQAGMYLAEPRLREAGSPVFTANMNPATAEKLFARSGHSFADILALAETAAPIRGFALNLSLRAKVAVETRTLIASNILGVLPGSDPMLSKQFVVVSAHLDQLRAETPIGGDDGAIDHASGVASVLEIAREMTASGKRPQRSVLFAVFTGEEKGPLGSRAFVEHPSFAGGALVADLDMDMFLPPGPLEKVMIQGVDESSLGQDARAVAGAHGYHVATDPYPDRNAFIGTDQYSFLRAGVPAISLKFASAPHSREQQMERDRLAPRYHSTSDDLNQAVDLEAAAKFNAYIQALTLRIADQDAQPAWAPGSIFAPPAPRAEQLLTVPIELPIGRRPQRNAPGYG